MNKPIRCVIIDDEQGAIDILTNYVSKVSWMGLSASFSDPVEALNYLSTEPVDLVFMDINMPDLNGIQLSRLVKARGLSIVFCTAYSEFAIESYELQALDYLLKPIPFERFLEAVNKLDSRQSSADEGTGIISGSGHRSIFIKSGSQIHQVNTDKIRFIKKDGHYIIFKVDGKELLSRMSFSQLLKLLPGDEFIQVHRSYVVAIDKIEVIQKQFLKIDGKEIPLGDAFKKQFFDRVKYIGN
ncbi:MAG: LytTR family DNA-binding domain-containing protein [Candidatus Marinimicrobia bacterium]|nr:LytTR family DNA-binding domain-containing protein [Candidatus Neomarinimicrobiota bacterium]